MTALWFFFVVVICLAVCIVAFVICYALYPDAFRRRSSALPQNIRSQIVSDIFHANQEFETAKGSFDRESKTLKDAQTALDALPADNNDRAAAEVEVSQAQTNKDNAEKALKEKQQRVNELMDLLTPPTILESISWGVMLQYAIFATLAGVVLYQVMGGITSNTTPRSMITFLIAVVTVGIALILVLASIVSSGDDREKRFAQGKEILTALLGVLGTIVGFYFGTSQEEGKSLDFEPVVVSRTADGDVVLESEIVGGKKPYTVTATFDPTTIASQNFPSDDGHLKLQFKPDATVPETSVLINVRDSDGKTGIIKHKISPSARASETENTSVDEVESEIKKQAEQLQQIMEEIKKQKDALDQLQARPIEPQNPTLNRQPMLEEETLAPSVP